MFIDEHNIEYFINTKHMSQQDQKKTFRLSIFLKNIYVLKHCKIAFLQI